MPNINSQYPNWSGNLETIDPSVTYLSSPSQLKRLPFSNFLHTLKIRIYYLPTKMLTTNTIQQKLPVLNICDEILQNAEHKKKHPWYVLTSAWHLTLSTTQY